MGPGPGAEVEEGQTGPLLRRLERYGRLLTWVMGAWQEGSRDLHSLLDTLADHKVAVLGLARGREASEQERAQILSGYRRTLSTTAARATSGCLLGRLAKVGESNRAAAKRRVQAKREGERLEGEMEDLKCRERVPDTDTGNNYDYSLYKYST